MVEEKSVFNHNIKYGLPKFVVPSLNFDANNYIDLVYWPLFDVLDDFICVFIGWIRIKFC